MRVCGTWELGERCVEAWFDVGFDVPGGVKTVYVSSAKHYARAAFALGKGKLKGEGLHLFSSR